MQELIKIDNENKVDARELHAFLEIGKDFSTWISEKINTYGFIIGSDYSPKLGNNTGLRGQPKKEYLLSLSCAKELCMLANNAKGKQARQYFIQCEEALKQLAAPPALSLSNINDAEKILKYALEATKEIKKLKPKADFYDNYLSKESFTLVSDAAAKIGISVSAVQINKYLQAKGYIYKDDRNSRWRVSVRGLALNIFSVKEITLDNGKNVVSVGFNNKGLAWLEENKTNIVEFYMSKYIASGIKRLSREGFN